MTMEPERFGSTCSLKVLATFRAKATTSTMEATAGATLRSMLGPDRSANSCATASHEPAPHQAVGTPQGAGDRTGDRRPLLHRYDHGRVGLHILESLQR